MTLPVGTTIYEWTSSFETPPSVYTSSLYPSEGDNLYNIYGEEIGRITTVEMGSYPAVFGTITESGYQGLWERTAGDTTSTTVQPQPISVNYISKLSNGTDTYVIKDLEARNSIDNLATVATTGSYNDLSDKPNLSGYEQTSNKVTSISSSSTNTQYPSAKCVYDIVGDIETILHTINSGS